MTLQTAQAITNGLPDYIDAAAYMLGNLSNYTSSGSNVSTTGSPWIDETAENQNWTQPSPPSGSISLYTGQTYAKTFGVNLAIYEHNFGNTSGTGATQLQLNQVSDSVGTGLDTVELALKARAQALLPGPTNMFTLPQNNFGYNCNAGTCSANQIGLWGTSRTIGTGPGQTPGTANVMRPQVQAMQVVNSALVNTPNLMSTTQSGATTFNYAAGQIGNGFEVYANPSVPYVWCTSYANSGLTTWTVICFNDNLTTANTVSIAGTYAPTGSVTQTVYPNSGNVITDNNENFFLGTGSISPVVTQPSPTSTSGTSYSIPAASMMTLTYNLGGTPAASTPTFSPTAGAYGSAQTVTISTTSAGAIICYNTTGSPATNGSTGCTTGTLYTTPVTVSSSETLYAVAGGTGYVDSTVGSAAYTISGGSTPKSTLSGFSIRGGSVK